MDIKEIINDIDYELVVSGRLDTNTVNMFDKYIDNIKNINSLILNFENLDYISSAGLRVLLIFKKALNDRFIIKNIKESVDGVLEITGFKTILNIK